MNIKKIFVICSVRLADDDYRKKLEEFTHEMESIGVEVHLPHRDTNQEASGLEICRQNAEAIFSADKVFVFYNNNSTGTHFDMGVAFALNKDIIVMENEKFGEGKSFAKMLNEWSKR